MKLTIFPTWQVVFLAGVPSLAIFAAALLHRRYSRKLSRELSARIDELATKLEAIRPSQP